MKITISDTMAFKTKDGWQLKYTLIHDMLNMDPWYHGKLFDLANEKIEEFLQIKITDKTPYPGIGPIYMYVPKDDAEEAQFLLRFPMLDKKRFDI